MLRTAATASDVRRSDRIRLSPGNGSSMRCRSRTQGPVSGGKKPSGNTVGRIVTTGKPDHASVCSPKPMLTLLGTRRRVWMLSATVIWDMFTSVHRTSRATAAMITVASRYPRTRTSRSRRADSRSTRWTSAGSGPRRPPAPAARKSAARSSRGEPWREPNPRPRQTGDRSPDGAGATGCPVTESIRRQPCVFSSRASSRRRNDDVLDLTM
jgi:hypothetical protein